MVQSCEYGRCYAVKIITIIPEDFVNYKVASLTIEFPYCTFKCGESVCQNSALAHSPKIDISSADLLERYYLNDPITSAIVLQGLEPLDSFDDVLDIIRTLRISYHNNDPVVIYTGYTEDEVADKISQLAPFGNIIVKFGRYIPNQKPHYDDVLGVNLASDNQYAAILDKHPIK